MWQQIKALIRRNRSFLVTTHVLPDGDAVGSQLALVEILRKLGKKVLAVNEHPLPRIYRFLDPRRTAKVYTQKLRRQIKRCDAAFIVDVSTPQRMGVVCEAVRETGITAVCIDHHKTHAPFADLTVLDPASSSAGEMIYDLARSLRVPITPRMAACLFVAMATDTGWFRFSNTSPRTLRVAADLVEKGVSPPKTYSAVHETLEWQRMALMQRALGTLRSECGGRIAHLHVTEQMFRDTGARDEDTEGFVDIPRVLRGVQLILFFRETAGKIKVSMRSKHGPPVHMLAQKHDGGGHPGAAGILMNRPLSKAMKTVLADARRLVRTGKL